MKTLVFFAPGMRCAGCASAISRAVSKLPGIERSGVDPISKRCLVYYDETQTTEEEILEASRKAGFPPTKELPSSGDDQKDIFKNALFLLALFCAAALFLLEWNILPRPGSHGLDGLLQLLLTVPALLWGVDIFKGAYLSLRYAHPDMQLLVGLSTASAFLYSLSELLMYAFSYTDHPHFHFCASAMVLAIVGLGKKLEERAKKNANASLAELSGLIPREAHLLENGREKNIPSDLLRPGDLVLVKPGERVPGDGRITEGRSALDESFLTGEGLPVDKGPGDEVKGGSMNLQGAFTLLLERSGGQTALAEMIRLVEEAQMSKPRIARISDVVAGRFSLGIILCAAITLAVWWIIRDFSTALPYALTVLVVACPCALGLATPAALSCGLGRAATLGVLFKDAPALETLSYCDIIFFDKTGTLTEGKPAVVGSPDPEALAAAASAEQYSEHPLAKAVLEKAKELGLPLEECRDFRSEYGKGVRGVRLSDGKEIMCGSLAFLMAGGVSVESAPSSSLTAVHVALDKTYLGAVFIADAPRKEAAEVIAALRRQKIECVLLTGDREEAAREFAKEVPLSRIAASCLPEDKLEFVKAAQNEGRFAAMTGDGVNDAPALAQADVSISHYKGAGAAQEAAKILLTRDDLNLILAAFRLSRKTLLIIKENLFWAFIFNAVTIPLAAGLFTVFGLPGMRPEAGAAAMALSSLLVVCNSLRLRKA